MNWHGLELPEAYYRDDAVYIIHGDCRLILPLIPDKSINLVLTDPPYKDDFIWAYRNIAEQGARILKDEALLFAYAGSMYLPTILEETTKYLTWIWLFNLQHHQFSRIWHHEIMQTSKPIIALSKGNHAKLNWLRTDLPAESADKRFHKQWGQAIGIPCLIISKVTNETAIILDPFLGAGTFAVAAKKLGRKCIGIEISEEYCAIAAKRCSQAVMALPIEPNQKEVKSSEIFFPLLDGIEGKELRGLIENEHH